MCACASADGRNSLCNVSLAGVVHRSSSSLMLPAMRFFSQPIVIFVKNYPSRIAESWDQRFFIHSRLATIFLDLSCRTT